MRRTHILQRGVLEHACKVYVIYLLSKYLVLSNMFIDVAFLCLSSYFFKACQVKSEDQPPTNDRTRWEIINIVLRSESPAMSIRRCQDANTITMHGLSKSF